MDVPEGDLDLLQAVLDGSNQEVDESAEERKGGAGDLGKTFLSAGTAQLAIITHVPAALAAAKGVTMQEWVDAVTAPVKEHAKVVSQSGEVTKIVVKGDPAKELFPLKMRDACTAAGFEFLRTKGLIPAGGDSSDDDVNYAEAAGVEW